MTDVIEVHSAQIRCQLCGFFATVDGAVSLGELTDMTTEIERMHGRQRHGEHTTFATIVNTYDQPTAPFDVDGRPERMN